MLICITGGARSGKSVYAQELARRSGKPVIFVATAYPSDQNLKARIARHQRDRPKHWRTLENPVDLASVFSERGPDNEIILVDCLTMYVAARLMENENEVQISARVEKFCKAAASSAAMTILVSNEVGSGVVPATGLGLQFQDDLGLANQIAARCAGRVVLMVSGLPVVLKDDSVAGRANRKRGRS